MSNLFTDFPSGLLSDFDFYITDARFGRDAKYNNGQTTQLFLTGKAVKDDVLVADDHEERYNCPPGWLSRDEGLTVVHENNAQNFNKNSQIAKLFVKVSEVAGNVIDKWVKDNATPFDALIWIGTAWHMMEVTEKYRVDGQDRETNRNFPAAFIGWSDATDTGPTTNGQVSSNTVSEESLIEQLRPMAQDMAHEDFVNAAIALDGITRYSSLVKRIADPDDLYAELRA